MRKIKKRGALEVSVSAIIIMILALTFLSLGLIFIKTMIGKLFNKFEEQISTEPEPPKPSYSKFITLSRNPIKTNDDTVEVIKISVLNPTIRNWGQRQFIKTETLCGNLDGICFIDTTDQTGKCNSMETAKQNDVDCKVSTGKLECKDDGKKAPCLISNLEGDLYCPNPKNGDPNCQPVEGVEIYFYCEKELMKEVFKRNIGPINPNEFKTNILLLKIKKAVPEAQYLCQIKVFAEDKEFIEDLVVDIGK